MIKHRIIVAGASSGWGHMQAAINIREWIMTMHSGVIVDVIDSHQYVSGISRFLYKTLWRALTLHAPWAYHHIHALLCKSTIVWKLAQRHAMGSGPAVDDLVRGQEIGVFVATHPSAVKLGAYVKGKTGCKLFVVSTDYVFHNLYCHDEVDQYFVDESSSAVGVVASRTFERKGLVRTASIPLSPTFTRPLHRKQCRKDLGLGREGFTILVTFGGEGLRFRQNLPLLYRLIETMPGVQWVLVSGRDRKLFRSLQKKFSAKRFSRNVILKGFVHNMASVMRAANIVFGKAGGLTVTEAVRMRLPVVIVDLLSGQEEYNVNYIRLHRIGIHSSTYEELCVWIQKLQDSKAYSKLHARFENLGGRECGGQIIAMESLRVLGLDNYAAESSLDVYTHRTLAAAHR
jgi:processive 1,2-diacylglycerol beta-glucosyltransferase